MCPCLCYHNNVVDTHKASRVHNAETILNFPVAKDNIKDINEKLRASVEIVLPDTNNTPKIATKKHNNLHSHTLDLTDSYWKFVALEVGQ